MALRQCPECGGPVSTEAEVCPHCGVDSPVADRRGWFLRLVVIGGIIAVFALLNRTNTPSNQTDAGSAKLSVSESYAQSGKMEPESEQQYCAIKDQLNSGLTANARTYDRYNALQLEEWEKADHQLYQKANVEVHQFFDTHNTFDKWAAKLDPGVSVIDNEMVKVEFKTTCGNTSLISVVSRNDTNIISLLRSAKTESHVLLSGPIQKIGYSDQVGRHDSSGWLEFWGSGPVYITFLMSSISAGIEASSIYPANRTITHALDVAAADAVRSGQDQFEKHQERQMEQKLRRRVQ
jgi:zinc-ribbon domain